MAPRIPDRWLNYKSIGKRIEGTRFVAFKVPLKEHINNNVDKEDRFDGKMLLDRIPNLGMIIDLTNTNRYYDPNFFRKEGVEYTKIMIPGHVTPPQRLVNMFKNLVKKFIRSNSDNDKLIGVHCTHGVNRTGYLICNYMVSEMAVQPKDAIEKFALARGHRIERNNYLDALQSLAATEGTISNSSSIPRQPVLGTGSNRSSHSSTKGVHPGRVSRYNINNNNALNHVRKDRWRRSDERTYNRAHHGTMSCYNNNSPNNVRKDEPCAPIVPINSFRWNRSDEGPAPPPPPPSTGGRRTDKHNDEGVTPPRPAGGKRTYNSAHPGTVSRYNNNSTDNVRKDEPCAPTVPGNSFRWSRSDEGPAPPPPPPSTGGRRTDNHNDEGVTLPTPRPAGGKRTYNPAHPVPRSTVNVRKDEPSVPVVPKNSFRCSRSDEAPAPPPPLPTGGRKTDNHNDEGVTLPPPRPAGGKRTYNPAHPGTVSRYNNNNSSNNVRKDEPSAPVVPKNSFRCSRSDEAPAPPPPLPTGGRRTDNHNDEGVTLPPPRPAGRKRTYNPAHPGTVSRCNNNNSPNNVCKDEPSAPRNSFKLSRSVEAPAPPPPLPTGGRRTDNHNNEGMTLPPPRPECAKRTYNPSHNESDEGPTQRKYKLRVDNSRINRQYRQQCVGPTAVFQAMEFRGRSSLHSHKDNLGPPCNPYERDQRPERNLAHTGSAHPRDNSRYRSRSRSPRNFDARGS